MTLAATSALAPDFTHAGGTVATFTFATGTSPVAVTLSAGTHRMWLAPSASCHLRLLAAAVAAQLSAARSPTVYTCVASVSAAGVLSLRIISAGALPTAVTFTAPSWRRLGYASATPSIATSSGYVDIAGTRPVWYLALFASLAGYAPQPQQSGGAEVDGGGVVYTFAGAATWWRQTADATLIPWTPTMRATQACEATAMYPDDGYLGALGAVDTAREWSLLDVLRVSRNALCGVALGTWATARTDTGVAIWRAYVAPKPLLSPEVKRTERSVEVWCEIELALTHPATATETRA